MSATTSASNPRHGQTTAAHRRLRRARHRRRPGRLHHRGAARAAGPRRGAGREGTPPALSHRRIAAAGQCAAVRAAGRARAGRAASACRSGASSSSRPSTTTAATSTSPTPGTRPCPPPGRCAAPSSTSCCSAMPPRAARARSKAARCATCSSTTTAPPCRPLLDDGTRAQLARALRGRRHAAATPCWPTSSAARKRTRPQQHGALRPLPQCAPAGRQARGQHQHLLVRARLVLVHSAGRRHHQRRRGVLALLPEVARQAAEGLLLRHHRAVPRAGRPPEGRDAGRRRGARHRQLLLHQHARHAASAT